MKETVAERYLLQIDIRVLLVDCGGPMGTRKSDFTSYCRSPSTTLTDVGQTNTVVDLGPGHGFI